MTPDQPILLFDGECHLCHSSVQWILKYDKAGVFRFASLQSGLAGTLLTGLGMPVGQLDTVVLIQGKEVWTHSSAVLAIAGRLGGWWHLMRVFWIVPRFVRDAVYNMVARNRYRWFGRHDACWMPRPEWRDRFLA
jgi:predicted DCC family thiol-disulfide oxidoreductase YuxK